MLYESENTEFKSQYTEGIYKSVIAFANAGGGTIYVGMNDDGTVIGLDDVDACYTRITNGVRDAIQPDVTCSFNMYCRRTASSGLRSEREPANHIILSPRV